MKKLFLIGAAISFVAAQSFAVVDNADNLKTPMEQSEAEVRKAPMPADEENMEHKAQAHKPAHKHKHKHKNAHKHEHKKAHEAVKHDAAVGIAE